MTATSRKRSKSSAPPCWRSAKTGAAWCNPELDAQLHHAQLLLAASLLREVQVLLLATLARVLRRRALELAECCAVQHPTRNADAAVGDRSGLGGQLCLASHGSRELQGVREQVAKRRNVSGGLGQHLVGNRRSDPSFGRRLALREGQLLLLLLQGAKVGRELVDQVAVLHGLLLLLGRADREVDLALNAQGRQRGLGLLLPCRNSLALVKNLLAKQLQLFGRPLAAVRDMAHRADYQHFVRLFATAQLLILKTRVDF